MRKNAASLTRKKLQHEKPYFHGKQKKQGKVAC